ncbi:class-II fumarase/aspartase family protein [Haloarcula sp. GH36]|uniref:class-II fumarase/aspartase family protein n=1 Tax=Haloarcula montana TaxID=3111776 RepID=UPI002D7801CE|nr:adenylosuccinate lyase family protein [Haloarcula sp. GH36]
MNPLLDGVLFRDVFTTKEMRTVFGETAFVDRFLEVEAALARAEAEIGIVPEDAATTITNHASVASIDMADVAANVDKLGLFSMSILEAWTDELGPAGEYVHWGASTQDVSDTAMVLLLRDAHEVLLRDVVAVRDQLATLADQYRETPMVGRTQYANGPPVTFGLKAATWVDELDRHVSRLLNIEEQLFVAQLAGASGTLSALGDDGIQVLDLFADELDLGVPRVGWTASRDRFAAFLNVLALVARTLARIAREILFLNRPEIDELEETVPEDELGSSTNPHKENPVFSQHTVGLARLVRSHAGTMHECLESMGERDRSAWYVEFALLPESCCYLARMLENTNRNLDGLTVRSNQMDRNLRASGALVLSEAVLFALARHVGRQTAHSILHKNAMRAVQSDRDFLACLKADDRVTDHLSEAQLESLVDPDNYTGLAEPFVDRVLDGLTDLGDP